MTQRSGAGRGAGPARFLLCTGRPGLAEELGAALDALSERPSAGGTPSEPLVFLDLTDGTVSVREARAALGARARLVAVADNRAADRLVDALAAGCCDYLFHPLNRDELRLLWRKHAQGEMPPSLPLDGVGGDRFHLVFPSEVRYLQPVVVRVVGACREAAGLEAEAAFRLRVALGEALTNAVLYGNRGDRGARVSVDAALADGEVRVTVADEGTGFDPEGVPDPSREENLGRTRGRGLFLIRRLADRVEFNAAGNRITLVIRVGAGPRPGRSWGRRPGGSGASGG